MQQQSVGVRRALVKSSSVVLTMLVVLLVPTTSTRRNPERPMLPEVRAYDDGETTDD